MSNGEGDTRIWYREWKRNDATAAAAAAKVMSTIPEYFTASGRVCNMSAGKRCGLCCSIAFTPSCTATWFGCRDTPSPSNVSSCAYINAQHPIYKFIQYKAHHALHTRNTQSCTRLTSATAVHRSDRATTPATASADQFACSPF